MARLTRVHQKVFASNASNNGVFGSLQAGNPQTSNDVATLQSLSAFENGWDDAIEQGDKLPPLEEFQGVQYGISYQQAYMLQEGIAEWDANTTYYKGSLTKTISGTSFKLYCSLADNNTGNVTTNTTYWKKVMDSDDVYALDSAVVHNTGNETIAGTKTISGSLLVPTKSNTDNSTNAATTAFVKNILAALYPVGSLYIGTQTTCPLSTLISGSTWTLVAQDNALWGGDGTNANTSISAGLPNITGEARFREGHGSFAGVVNTSGCIGGTNTGKIMYPNGGDDTTGSYARTLTIDASTSSPIYGASTTVQPPAYRVNVWRRTA